ncbi:MAG: flagellar basal body rod protein FlgB [Bradyrhizobium sp.]|nr:flagellar basal body rod protein FlgB [Bradyrhizobium sp.]
MGITDIPILSMIRTRMEYAQERQRVLAENVANADTPRYRARDLVAPKFDAAPGSVRAPMVKVALAQTDGAHIAATGQSNTAFRTQVTGSHEVSTSGNAVSLEEEMIKVAANQMDYQAATALYTRSLGLIKTALGKR